MTNLGSNTSQPLFYILIQMSKTSKVRVDIVTKPDDDKISEDFWAQVTSRRPLALSTAIINLPSANAKNA
jgi:hypothetical protein